MRKRKGNIEMKKWCFIICCSLLIAAVILLPACTSHQSDTPERAKGTMNMELGENGMIRNGTEYRTYQVETGQRGILSVRISSVSGRLDMDISLVGSNEEPDYTARELDSQSFDVLLEKPGEYEVCFMAEAFVGEYGIGWRTENLTDN